MIPDHIFFFDHHTPVPRTPLTPYYFSLVLVPNVTKGEWFLKPFYMALELQTSMMLRVGGWVEEGELSDYFLKIGLRASEGVFRVSDSTGIEHLYNFLTLLLEGGGGVLVQGEREVLLNRWLNMRQLQDMYTYK